MLKKLVGYAAYMFGANMVTGLLTFGVGALGLVTRPKEAVGDYDLYMAVYQVGQGLFIYGANASIQRFSAGDDQNRLRFSALALWLFFALLALTAALGTGVGVLLAWNYAFALFGLPWLVLNWWARYIARSNIDAKREAWLMAIASLANSIFQFLFLTFTDYRDALIYGDFAALIAGGIAGLAYLRITAGVSLLNVLKTKIPRALLSEAWKFGLPIWWSGQIFSVRYQLQTFWTGGMLGKLDLGTKNGMNTMWQFTQKPVEYLGNAALPGLVKADEERSKLYQEVLRFCIAAFTFIGIAVAAGAPLVFQVVDAIAIRAGRSASDALEVKYADVPALLRMLALLMPIQAFQIVTNPLAVAGGRPRAVLIANIATVVCLLGSLYPLTKQYGLFGVVAAGQIGDVASAVTYAIVLWKIFPREVRTGLWWTGLATVCACLALLPVQLYADWRWNWAISFPAVAIYTGLLFVVRVLEVEDLRRVLRAIRGT